MSLSIQGWTFYQSANFVTIVSKRDTLPNTVTTNLRVKCAAEPMRRSSTAVNLINDSFLPSILFYSSPHFRSCVLHVLTSHVISNRRVPSSLMVFHLSGGVPLDSWIWDIGDGMQFNVFHINTSKTDKFNWKNDWHWRLLDYVYTVSIRFNGYPFLFPPLICLVSW